MYGQPPDPIQYADCIMIAWDKTILTESGVGKTRYDPGCVRFKDDITIVN